MYNICNVFGNNFSYFCLIKGFWRFYLRNNDTYPFVMPAPRCSSAAVKNLWECEGFTQEENIPLSENLCQGEDDLGIYCWGPPSFNGWSKHWKGIQLYNSPSVFRYVNISLL